VWAGKIADRDPTLWGPEAESEASKRLNWSTSAEQSRPLVEQIEALREELAGQGIDHVVLCGMGGSSLAPEVITRTAGVELKVLDSSDPDYVRAATTDRLESTVVVVSSKSGGTVETDSQKRAYEQAFRAAGHDPADHIVVGHRPRVRRWSPKAPAAGLPRVRRRPLVGWPPTRALTAFGLVPSGLAGADISEVLDEAAGIHPALARTALRQPRPAARALLGAAVGRRQAGARRPPGTPIVGFGDWVEQLIAESTASRAAASCRSSSRGPTPPTSTEHPDEVLVGIGPDPSSTR
jgi:glucose-6-phosphate isomerase